MRFVDAPLYARQIIIASFIIALALSIIGLFTAVRLCRKRRLVVASAITFVLSFASVFLTMRGSYRYRVGLSVFEPSSAVLELPFWLHCAVSVALLALISLTLAYSVWWRRRNISPLSIKESAESLPAGICFYEESGLVRLINSEMNRLCILSQGKTLLNGTDFWRRITSGEVEDGCVSLERGEKPIVEYEDGKVVSFKRYAHDIDGKVVYEVVASDISERYRHTKELERKLVELRERSKRLVAYGEGVEALMKEKELLAAKIRIHDDMGKILLTTKRKLSQPLTKADQKELVWFWRTEISALKDTKKLDLKNNLQVIMDAARLVGVDIEFCGDHPKAGTPNERVLIAAMHECLTNTVSHANGRRMTVFSLNGSINGSNCDSTTDPCNGSKSDSSYTIRISNDGESPKGEIIEGGGLSNLRSLVEREKGMMTITSLPRFELVIEMPYGEKNIEAGGEI